MQVKIIIVEDDLSIAELIHFNLAKEGYLVETYGNGKALLDDLVRYKADEVSLFVLDVMLPGISGFQLCEQLKADERFQLTSFLFLTARGTEHDKLAGFASGADDYMTKPFGMKELLARVKVLVARQQQRIDLAAHGAESSNIDRTVKEELRDQASEDQVLHIGRIQLDHLRHQVTVAGQEVELTKREYDLLKFLMENRGFVFTRDHLLNQVWGYDYPGETRTVDVHIRQLRRKLEEDSSEPQWIETVRGVGYRFKAEN